MTKKESIIILFSITLCWSSSYVFIKDIPQEFSVYAYLALTSGVAGAILAFVMRRKLRLLNRVSLRQGLILGALVTASNMFEKMGLDRIPAPVGLVFGPVGALACAMGNLLGDMAHFSRYGGTHPQPLRDGSLLCGFGGAGGGLCNGAAGVSLSGSPLMKVMAALAVGCAAATCLMEGREAKV